MSLKNVIIRGLKFVEGPGGLIVDAAAKIIASPLAADSLTVEIKDKRYVPYKKGGTEDARTKIGSYNTSIDDTNVMLTESMEGAGDTYHAASDLLLSYKDDQFQMADGFKSILSTTDVSSSAPDKKPKKDKKSKAKKYKPITMGPILFMPRTNSK